MKNENNNNNINIEIENLEELGNGESFFFWLGADGRAESVTPEEFKERIEAEREALRRWENAEDGQ